VPREGCTAWYPPPCPQHSLFLDGGARVEGRTSFAREETVGPLWWLSEETRQHHGILAFMRECMCVGGGGGVRVVWR